MSADFTLSRRSLLRSIVSARRCQHRAQRAARLAGAHDVDVEAREDLAVRVERLRQRLAAAHVVANALQQRARPAACRRRPISTSSARSSGSPARSSVASSRVIASRWSRVTRLRREPAGGAGRVRRPWPRPWPRPAAARATCMGIRPWSRRRSTISDSFAASSSPAATVAGGVDRLVAITGPSA